MAVTLHVYESDNTTFVDDLTTPRLIRWSDDLTGPGGLTFEFSAGEESASTLIRADRIVRVDVDGTDVYSAVVRSQVKRRIDEDVAVVTVNCVGLRALLADAIVYPEIEVDGGLRTSDVRYFGWTSSNTIFDHSSWTAAQSHGRADSSSNSFNNLGLMPDDWPVGSAELIWSAHSVPLSSRGLGTADPGFVYFRKSFTTDEDHEVIWYGSANDEVIWYIDGQEIQRSVGPYQWKQFGATPFTLPAGTHVLAALGNNLARPTAVTAGPRSSAWILGAMILADTDGQPASTNETWSVHTTATGGTFTLTFDDVDPTAAIAYNASAAAVKSALEATHPSIEVTVTGSGTSGDPWIIEATGDEVAGVPHSLTGDGANLTGGSLSIVNTVDGAYAEVILKTDTTWRHLPYPSDPPGVTWGAVMKSLLDEAQTRGDAVDALTESFSFTADSDSTAWSEEVNLALQVGTTIEQVVAMAEDAGLDFHISPTGSVGLYESKGSDVSATVDFEYLQNLTALDHRRDGRRYDRLLVRTESGWVQAEAAAVGTPAKEGYVSAGGFETYEDFQTFVNQLFVDYGAQADVTTFSFPDAPGELTPALPTVYTDMTVGDTVAVTDWQRNQTKQRVLSIAATVDDNNGEITWTVEAQDTGVAAP